MALGQRTKSGCPAFGPCAGAPLRSLSRSDRRKDAPMNPADVSASALPLTSSDLSLWHLFWQAHWLVKTVMTGLMVCSVWVWAIAIDKTFLFSRFRRAADSFEQAFWSGQSLEDLYKTLAAKPGYATGA